MGYVTGKETGLFENGGLVPPDMLVVEPVAPDVDNAEHGNRELGVGGGHVG